jgi:hypothetical protein
MPPDADEPFHDDYFGTFCVYCQRDYGTEAKLFKHIKRNHQDTYASNAVRQREERRKQLR